MFISHGRGAPTAWASAAPPGTAMNIINTASSRRYQRHRPIHPASVPQPGPVSGRLSTAWPTGPRARDQGSGQGKRPTVARRQRDQADQLEDAERRHGRCRDPRQVLGREQRLRGEVGMPAERARRGRQATLDPPQRPVLGGEMADEQDVAAGPHHPPHLRQQRARMRHHRGHEHRHGDVERGVGKVGRLRVHLAQRHHVGDLAVGDALAGLRQHLGGQVDAGDPPVRIVVGQGKAGADADLEHVAARAGGSPAPRRGGAPAGRCRRTPRRRCPPSAGRRHAQPRRPSLLPVAGGAPGCRSSRSLFLP